MPRVALPVAAPVVVVAVAWSETVARPSIVPPLPPTVSRSPTRPLAVATCEVELAALPVEVAAEVKPAFTVPLMMPVEPMVTPVVALPASLMPIRLVELLPVRAVAAPPFTLVELAPTVAVVAPTTLPD